MLRTRQQYWFCLAGICLVGSLMLIWSPEIKIMEEVSSAPVPIPAAEVVRRLSDLPKFATSSTQSRQDIPRDHMPWEESRQVHSRLVVPAIGHSSIGQRSTAKQDFAPASYQREVKSQIPQAVWFSGQIEESSPTRDTAPSHE